MIALTCITGVYTPPIYHTRHIILPPSPFSVHPFACLLLVDYIHKAMVYLLYPPLHCYSLTSYWRLLCAVFTVLTALVGGFDRSCRTLTVTDLMGPYNVAVPGFNNVVSFHAVPQLVLNHCVCVLCMTAYLNLMSTTLLA